MSDLPVFYLLSVLVAISGLILTAWAWRAVVRVRQLELEIPKLKANSATKAKGSGEDEKALHEAVVSEEFSGLQFQIKEFEKYSAETRAAVEAALMDLNMAAAAERSIVQSQNLISKIGHPAPLYWSEPDLFEAPIIRAEAGMYRPLFHIFKDREGRYRRAFISSNGARLEVGESFSSFDAARDAPLPEEWIVSSVDVKASQRG
jgi:uncharacterized protein YegP (UPF0339 family)